MVSLNCKIYRWNNAWTRCGFALILSLLCAIPMLYGQAGKVYVSNNPVGSGIAVRWAGPEISYREGINIYRKERRKGWERMTAQPIMPPTSVPTDLGLSSNDIGMVDAFLKTDPKEFVEGFGGILTLMQSLKRYPLALALRIAWNDESAENGKKYVYKVEAIQKGQPLLIGESEEIKGADFTPPAAPEEFSFERKKRRTFIWWENDPLHYYAYNLYVKKQGEAEFTLHTKEMGAQDIGEKKDKFIDLRTHKDTSYTIRLEALDYFGGKSVMSEELEVEILDFDPPTTPQLLVRTDSRAATCHLSWQRPPESDLVGYDIYRRKEEVDTLFTKINRKPLPPEDTSYTDKVNSAGAYSYQLIALDEAGNTAASMSEFGEIHDIIPPPIPQYVALKPDTGVFVIRWQPVKAADLRGYVVMRSVADEDNSDNIFMPASEIIDTNYFAEPMSPNVRSPFVYIIRSVDSSLNYSLNSEEVVGQLPDVTPPVAPLIKSVTAEGEALRISWVENVEKDLKGYRIYKRILGDTTAFRKLNISLVPADISAYTDKDIDRGQSCEYYVEAVDFAGLRSPASNIAIGKQEHLPLEGEIRIARHKFVAARSEFNLSWSGEDLRNEPVVGYAIYRSIDGARPLQRGKVTQDTQFKEKLSRSGNYEYHIRAYGERGNVLYSEPIIIEMEAE